MKETKAVVRWHDGTYDSQRLCIECHQLPCNYTVYSDYYKEVIVRQSYGNIYEESSDESI